MISQQYIKQLEKRAAHAVSQNELDVFESSQRTGRPCLFVNSLGVALPLNGFEDHDNSMESK